MKDYSELKILAEKATPGEWAHEQDNLYFYEDGYTRHMMEISEGSDIGYVEQKHNSDFIAAANPEVILELIAEVEILKYDCQVANSCVNAEKKESKRIIDENESLKKDAARYRWTTIEGNWVARMFGKWRAHIGEYGDSNPTDWFDTREEAIDAAMSNKD